MKPIFGCETYVAPDRLDKTERRINHLILLAKNEVGWKNLSYLNSMGYLEGFYYNPRIDKPLLREHAEGLIGLSACLGGEIAQTIRRRGPEAAEERRQRVRGHLRQGQLLPRAAAERARGAGAGQRPADARWRKKTGIPLVATNDCHYLNQDDARAHEILMCVQQSKTINDEKRLHHRNDAFFIKSPAEMDGVLQAHARGAGERREASASCATSSSSSARRSCRSSRCPTAMTAESYLHDDRRATASSSASSEAHRARRQVRRRRLPRARLALELGVIQKMGFSGYFLIVWDFINYAKEHGIPVGPGRGSGAGSLVA